MKRLLTIISLCFTLPLAAQQAMYIAPGARIQVGQKENIGIFGNVVNDGAFGTADSAIVTFFGKSWTNGMGATMPDGSQNGYSALGGIFRFSGNNPLYGDVGAQQVFGGYSIVTRLGATFPNVEINNRLGVLMADLSDMKVRNNLQFTTGHLFLNGWNLVVGDGKPGEIRGYNEQSFIVTGADIAGGFLYREHVNGGGGKIVFPIGSSVSSYAPLALEYGNQSDDVRARVFDSVYQYAISGQVNRLDFTNKTWNVGSAAAVAGQTKLTLQHMDKDEAKDYAAFRSVSYVSRFVNNAWEQLADPESFPEAGNLTTTNTLRNATMHVRTFNGLTNNEYFTKASVVYGPYAPAVFMLFNAYRLNQTFAQLDWSVSRELNNDHFEIERRYERDTGFTKVGELRSVAPNGNSNVRIDYHYPDPNAYDGWTYYRIKSVSRNGRVSYSEIRAVPPFLTVDVWPNPNYGQFQVRIKGERTDLIMQIVNVAGQVVDQRRIQGEATVIVNALARGTYVLAFIDPETNRLMLTRKVVVLDRR
ncbi:T9SS type A sorting domain-containing protein [Chitinophaga lutea]